MEDTKKPAIRTEQGRFQKGVSGNPSGRRSDLAQYRDKCRQHTDEAIKTLVEALGDGDGRVRVAAAQALLDRGWGKPTQPISGDDNADPVRLDLALIEILRKMTVG